MNQLTVNGISFGGELPDEWTVGELVRVLETEVLFADEVVVEVTLDGAPFVFAPETPGPRLAAVDSVTIGSRRVGELVDAAIASASETARRFAGEVGEAAAALRVGRDAEGWEAQARAMVSLRLFLDLAERLATTLAGGLGDGPEAGARVRAVATELAARLGAAETVADADDPVGLCDAMEDLADWLLGAWEGVWASGPATHAGERLA